MFNPENYKSDWLSYWQPNYIVSKCNNCQEDFTLFNRKHHCRKCGKIFCQDCWGNMMYVEIYKREVPVCHKCNKNSN